MENDKDSDTMTNLFTGLGEILTTPLWESKTKKGPLAKANPKTGKAATTMRAHFTFQGELQPGKASTFSINDQDFVVDADTWVFGDLQIGVQAVVQGTTLPDGNNYARKITVGKF